MRVVQLNHESKGNRIGAVLGDDVYDLTAVNTEFSTVLDLIVRFDENDLRSALQRLLRDAGKRRWRYSSLTGKGEDGWRLGCPVNAPEVWGAGVTYELSREARVVESKGARSFYADVYRAKRPELFLKTAGMRRVACPGGAVGVRRDSSSTIPEPEFAVILGRNAKVVGYTLANDVTARDIEAENPLYLPQAKIFDYSCSFGPDLYIPESLEPGSDWEIHMNIMEDGKSVFSGSARIDGMARSIGDILHYLNASNTLPVGTVLMTGTGIVPGDNIRLRAGARISIEFSPIGMILENSVIELKGSV